MVKFNQDFIKITHFLIFISLSSHYFITLYQNHAFILLFYTFYFYHQPETRYRIIYFYFHFIKMNC